MLGFCLLKLTCFCQSIFIFVNIYSICILNFYKKVWARNEIYVAWQYMCGLLTNVGPLPIIVILFLLKPTYICKYLFQIFIFTFNNKVWPLQIIVMEITFKTQRVTFILTYSMYFRFKSLWQIDKYHR